jgi:hypothetical protein
MGLLSPEGFWGSYRGVIRRVLSSRILFHDVPEEHIVSIFTVLLSTCSQIGFLLDIIFDPEEGSDMFLQKVG